MHFAALYKFTNSTKIENVCVVCGGDVLKSETSVKLSMRRLFVAFNLTLCLYLLYILVSHELFILLPTTVQNTLVFTVSKYIRYTRFSRFSEYLQSLKWSLSKSAWCSYNSCRLKRDK